MTLLTAAGEKENIQTIDVSQGGVCFLYPRPLKTDTEIKVQMELLKKKKTISARAKVSWLKKTDRMPGEKKEQYKTGLEFISMDNKDKESLLSQLKLYYE